LSDRGVWRAACGTVSPNTRCGRGRVENMHQPPE
jgi:hypothetical protein